jgi:hypothetical protein
VRWLVIVVCLGLLGCLSQERPLGHPKAFPPLSTVAPLRSLSAALRPLLVLGAWDAPVLQPVGAVHERDALVYTTTPFAVGARLREELHEALSRTGARVVKDSCDLGWVEPYASEQSPRNLLVLRGEVRELWACKRGVQRLGSVVDLRLHAGRSGEVRWESTLTLSLPCVGDPLPVLADALASSLVSDAAFLRAIQ